MVYAEMKLSRALEVEGSDLVREYVACRRAADEVVSYARSRGFEVTYGRVGGTMYTELAPDREPGMQAVQASDEAPPGP